MAVKELDAFNIAITLAQVYWIGSIVFCFLAACMLTLTTITFLKAYNKLPRVLQTQWTIIVPQWWVAINYLGIDIVNLMNGELRPTMWCYIIAYASIFWALTGRMYWALNGYASYRMANQDPMSDTTLSICNILIWIGGALFAGAFYGQLGPFKGLYCCVKEDTYYTYATAPCFFATFGGFVVAMYFYWAAVQACTNKGAAWNVRKTCEGGFSMAFFYYLIWTGVYGNGVITALGGKVPTRIDMFAGWIVKCLPLVHGFILQDTIYQVLNKPKSEEKAAASSAKSSAASSAKPGLKSPPPSSGSAGGTPGSPSMANRPSMVNKPTGGSSSNLKPGASASVAPAPQASKPPVASVTSATPPATASNPSQQAAVDKFTANAANRPPVPLLSDRVAAIVAPDKPPPSTTTAAPAPAPAPTMTIVTVANTDPAPKVAAPAAAAPSVSPLTIITNPPPDDAFVHTLRTSLKQEGEGKGTPVALTPLKSPAGMPSSPSFKTGGMATAEVLMHSGPRSPARPSTMAEGKVTTTSSATPRSPYKAEGKGAAYIVLDSARRTPNSSPTPMPQVSPRTPRG